MSGQTPRVLVLCPDWPQPSGGVRKMYRHVDVLNAHGMDAVIVHDKPGFRCNWFENETKVTSRPELWPPRPSDVLVCPELIAWQSMNLAPGIRKVVFNQGAYQTFLHVTPEIHQLVAPYCHPDFLGTIVVSEDSRRYLQFVFPKHPVFRIYNAVDPALFRYEPK